ncbi:hypothetical protein KVR01_010208 [Diaporthe batatas]|uniref:uncharacterized protein n=1 Tax=Diaporthe batatas TaxID=748121 RepID=UPI001D0495F8|nr:uncharacterized protein KVR01_010208 [Diaporthe batatas]KAG8159571.1 hypothetical protein KVR01_010208 [Diaporthe batatas]
MSGPLEVIGAVSAVVQLIGGVSSGLRTLRDAVVAIKDAPRAVQRLEEKIQNLGHCFRMLERYFESRPSRIPFETQLYELIQEIAASCTAPLMVLKEKIPTRSQLSKKHITAAFDLWLNNSAITQAKTQINESIPYLNLLLQTLNLFKADQADDLLRQIAASLNQTAQPQHPIPHPIADQNAALYEFNSHTLETTLRGIRTFANDATAFYVQSERTTATSSRYIGTLRPGDTPTVSSTVQSPTFTKARRQLEFEWEQNRKDVERHEGYGLYENAEKIQRRALSIKEELSNQHGVPFSLEEREEMEEKLADILIECKTEGSTEKAISLIEKIIGESPRDRETDNSDNLLTSPGSPTSDDKKLSLHYKLGRLYKSTGQMDLAEKELRTAFNAYAEECPQDTAKIREAGEELLELYDIRVEFGDREHRPVFLSQLHGFKQELQSLTGRPLEHRQTTCDRALAWCDEKGIAVARENDQPRFDLLGEDNSSPLHHAAESCTDELALQQMMENSDTLESRDGHGDTPLLAAVGASNTAALGILLQKGASASARDSQGQTALHRSQKPAVTKFLLHHRLRRASTMTSGLFDDAAAAAAVARRFSSSSSSASTLTTSPPGSVSDDGGLDINAQDATRKTALYLACWQGRARIVSLLLLAGADPNIAAHGDTPLSITVESQARAYARDPGRKVDIVAALVARGADPGPGRRRLLPAAGGPGPRGMQREILRALEGGRAGAAAQAQLLLQPSLVSETWTAAAAPEGGGAPSPPRRDSGYQPSLSSSSVASGKPQIEHLDFGPALLTEEFKPD